ncbi:MAG: cytochrome C oxidase subunit IV family protein [Candidatus Omnitrophica bacterium]|nr:cytochrome C oxidase subunit IV family protein [Candidatus Omnitrophota bacterium]
MSQDHKKLYIWNAVWLTILTVAELFVVKLPLAKAGQVALLLAFALTKMILVLMVYMHLRYETKALKIALAIPIPLAVLFLVSLMYDLPYQMLHF